MRRTILLLAFLSLVFIFYLNNKSDIKPFIDEIFSSKEEQQSQELTKYDLPLYEGESQLGSEMEAAFTSYELPPIEQIQLIRLLRKKDFQTLENTLQSYFDEFSNNVVYEGKIIGAFDIFGFESDISEHLDEWRKQYPDSAYARLAKGIYYRRQGWNARGGDFSHLTTDEQFSNMEHYFSLAEEELRDALNINPKLSPAYCDLIDMAAARSMRKEKVKWYKKGKREIPHTYNIRWCYFHKLLPRWGGSYQEMESFVARSIKFSEDNPRILLLNSYIPYFKAGDYAKDEKYEKAILEMTKSINYVKRWYNYYSRGKYYKSVGEYELALKDIENSYELRPDAFAPLMQKGLILRKLGRAEESLTTFNHAISLYPRKSPLYNSRALIYWDFKDYQKAHDDYASALEINPSSSYAWEQKGRLNHYHLNNSVQAVIDLSKATGLNSDPDTWYEYASVLYYTKDMSAVPAYRSFLNLCQLNQCDSGKELWATRFLACVTKQPSCSWKPEFYAHWVIE